MPASGNRNECLYFVGNVYAAVRHLHATSSAAGSGSAANAGGAA
jgi:hypothetical protein